MILLVGAAGSLYPSNAIAQALGTVRASREHRGESELDVHVRYGAGRFTMSSNSSRLYELNVRYDEDAFTPVHEYRAGRLVVGIDGNGPRSMFGRNSSGGTFDLTLSDQVPMDLELEFGAVRAGVDLGGLRLRTLDLTTGASEAELRVSEPNPEPMESIRLTVGAASLHATELGNLNVDELILEAGVGDVRLDFLGLVREETRIRAEMGMGRLEIRIPSEAGIRLVRDSFLTTLDAPELVERNDAFFSSNWDSSSMKVRIEVKAAFGKVSVLRVD